MAFPQHIEAALASTDAQTTFSASYTNDKRCEGAKFHSPQPLLVRARPLATGEIVYLCGTCSDNLTVLTQLLVESNGELAWEVRREFGNGLREIGLRGHHQGLKENVDG